MPLYEAIPPERLRVESKPLYVPSLENVAKAIQTGLSNNFEYAEVRVIQCPDLTQKPFNIADKGIGGGKQRIMSIGGVPYLTPLAQKDKLYDMRHYPCLTDMCLKETDKALIIGAGAAPWTYLGRNAEMMPNLTIDYSCNVAVQKTTICRTMDENAEPYKLVALPKEESKMAILGELFLSKGKPSPVLSITCRTRSGDKNLVSSISNALREGFPDKCIGLGGAFCVTKGKLKVHIMPNFSETPIHTAKEFEEWLKFYDMDAPFTCLSVLVSRDPGLDLERLEHSHGFNFDKGQGGHYHYDTSPATVEYVAYYNIAEAYYRVDRPDITHRVGAV